MRVYLGVGANLGDRAANLWRAVRELGETEGVRVRRLSPLYESAPVGPVAQPSFLNAVLVADATCEPLALLEIVKAVEWRLGHQPGSGGARASSTSISCSSATATSPRRR